MAWKFNYETPIYLQIMDELKLKIASGAIKTGDRLPAVRELAVEAGVNPNTMQKALSELEREGILYSQRTSGRFVSSSSEVEKSLKRELSSKYIDSYIAGMTSLGYENSEMIDVLKEYMEEKNE